MAKTTLKKAENIQTVHQYLSANLPNLGITMQLVDSSTRHLGDVTFHLMVYEKYYYRSRNRASMTVLLVGDEHETHADIISSGGGQGVFLRWSWGTEQSFVNQVKQLMINYGFREQ